MILSAERKLNILEQLHAHGKVNAVEIARLFDVSMETIRRDLDSLEKEGVLKRVHGGAIKSNYKIGEPPFVQRQGLHIEAKQKVAKQGVQMLKDGDTIVMGGGTTILEMARAIRGVNNLTILTNSVPTANSLMDSLNQGLFHGKVIILGGELNPELHSTRGTVCEKMLDLFNVHKAFISPGGISLSGVTEYDLEDSGMSKKMIEIAKEVVIVVDHSKIGIEALSKISPFKGIDIIICDQDAPSDWEPHLKNVEWITADKEQEAKCDISSLLKI